jgi:mono/diheme cytochrome c family protein
MRSLALVCAGALLAAGIVLPATAAAQAPGGQPVSAPPAPAGNAQRGAYIAQQVAMCVQCHSPRDERGALIDAQKFGGGKIPSAPAWAASGDWAFVAPRIAGLSGYTVEQGVRLLTEGRTRSGRVPRAPMPPFRMAPQDAADVVAYLKSLQ